MSYEICVIGSQATLFPFLQFGFATYTPQSETALRKYTQEAIEKNYGIIYVEDSFCFLIKDMIEKCRENLTPIIVPIGENEDGESFSKLFDREMMEKAIGINVI